MSKVHGSLLHCSQRPAANVAITFDADHPRIRRPLGHSSDMLIPDDSEDEDEELVNSVWYAQVLQVFEYNGHDLALVRYYDWAQLAPTEGLLHTR